MKHVKTRFVRNLPAVSGQIQTPAGFILGEKSPSYAVTRSLNGARNLCRPSGEIFLALAVNRTTISRSSVR
jgi:hypothetical protein